MVGRTWSLIVKELLAVWRDPRSRAVLIVPPLLQLVVFANAVTQEVRNVPIAVLNRDWGQESRELVRRFAETPTFTSVTLLDRESEVAAAIDRQRVLMVIEISADFSRALAAGTTPTIELVLDGRRSNSAQIVAGYATSVIAGFAAERVLHLPPAGPARAVLVTRAWFNPNLDAKWSTVPNLVAVLTAVVGLVVTGLTIAREREF